MFIRACSVCQLTTIVLRTARRTITKRDGIPRLCISSVYVSTRYVCLVFKHSLQILVNLIQNDSIYDVCTSHDVYNSGHWFILLVDRKIEHVFNSWELDY